MNDTNSKSFGKKISKVDKTQIRLIKKKRGYKRSKQSFAKATHWSQQTHSSNNTSNSSTHGLTRWSTPKSDRLQSLQLKMEKHYTLSINKTSAKPGADCGSDHELLIANFRLKRRQQGKPLDHSGMTQIKSLMVIQGR